MKRFLPRFHTITEDLSILVFFPPRSHADAEWGG